MALQIPDTEDPRGQLSDDGCKGHTEDAHPHCSCKKEIQDNIDDGGDEQKEEGGAAVTEALQNARIQVEAQISDNTDKDDNHICPGHFQCAVVGNLHKT